MTRQYDSPVIDRADVRRHDDDPDQFVWRGRFYLVRAVLARWKESACWWDRRAGGDPDQGSHRSLDRERELWRVEAAAGSAASLGVYDLCFDWTTGSWTVARVQD